ncbi:MAG: hypothetical protein H6985_15655 [Pseudomonadales bacterium]|nr:hypothetical protein [Halioglobus sp.]MCB1700161.1 hypothetical protein [Halioglobus sp.]MCP5131008.1 hypothetical protein [Pseudomonadales bacterium]
MFIQTIVFVILTMLAATATHAAGSPISKDAGKRQDEEADLDKEAPDGHQP